MSGTRCEAIHWMLPLFACSVGLGLLVPKLERPLLYFLALLATASHWHYGAVVVQQLCKHFGRICFKVTKVEPVRMDEVGSEDTTQDKMKKEHDQ